MLPDMQSVCRGGIVRGRKRRRIAAARVHAAAARVQATWRGQRARLGVGAVLTARARTGRGAGAVVTLQKAQRAAAARAHLAAWRDKRAADNAEEAKARARFEVVALTLQRVVRGHLGRELAAGPAVRARARAREQWLVEDKAARVLSNFVRPFIARQALQYVETALRLLLLRMSRCRYSSSSSSSTNQLSLLVPLSETSATSRPAG